MATIGESNPKKKGNQNGSQAHRPGKGTVGGGTNGGMGTRGRGRPLANDEDRIEREVRRRLSEAMVAAGVPFSRLSLEILWLLPEDFVRNYSHLYEQAFGDASGVGSSLAGYGQDEGKVVSRAGNGQKKGSKREGRDAEGKRTGGDRPGEAGGLSTRSTYRSGQVGGKRYTRAAVVVRDELALEAKGRIDKKIRQVIREELKSLKEAREEQKARDEHGSGIHRGHGEGQ